MTRTIPLVMLIFLFFSCKTEKTKKIDSRFQTILETYDVRKPVIMSHRGRLNVRFPENAIASFEEIHQFSNNLLIEFDVRMTKDSVLVLLHDETLDRTTTGKGLLIEKNYKELLEIRLVTGLGDTTNYGIPTFSDALAWASDKNFIVIDAKPVCNVRDIAIMVHKMNLEDRCMVVCNSLKDALEYQRVNPNLILAVGINSLQDLEAIKKSGLSIKNLVALTPTSLQDESFYEEIKSIGVNIAYGTYSTLDEKPFDSVKAIYQQHAAEFEIITTDRSDLVYDFLVQKK